MKESFSYFPAIVAATIWWALRMHERSALEILDL
jgi:hypothetical protein